MNNKIEKYFSVDSTGDITNIRDFEKLINDNYSIDFLNNAKENREFLLKEHWYILDSALHTVDNIQKQIDILNNK